MICPLCQKEFDEKSACKGCGLRNGCQLIRCPSCGYEFVEESKTVNFIQKIFNFFKKRKTQ